MLFNSADNEFDQLDEVQPSPYESLDTCIKIVTAWIKERRKFGQLRADFDLTLNAADFITESLPDIFSDAQPKTDEEIRAAAQIIHRDIQHAPLPEEESFFSRKISRREISIDITLEEIEKRVNTIRQRANR